MQFFPRDNALLHNILPGNLSTNLRQCQKLAPFSPLRLRNINPISPCFLSLHTLLDLLTPVLSSSASRSPPVRFIPVFRAAIFPCSPLPLLSKNKYSEYFMCDLTPEDNFLIKPSRTNDRVTCRSDFGC